MKATKTSDPYVTDKLINKRIRIPVVTNCAVSSAQK